jgi:RimJ/RimL family protein N-acetyltransferase
MTNENTPTITTERLILRRFTADDAEALFELLRDEETNTFLPWFPLKSLEEARDFLQRRFLDYYEKASAYRYAVCLKADDKPIGYVCLADDESRDLGYGLKKEFWHKGIATETARAVAERIKNAGYTYITATHDVNNPRSGEVMKKLGMTYKYSYVEQWQPKDIPVTFRLYQLNFSPALTIL